MFLVARLAKNSQVGIRVIGRVIILMVSVNKRPIFYQGISAFLTRKVEVLFGLLSNAVPVPRIRKVLLGASYPVWMLRALLGVVPHTVSMPFPIPAIPANRLATSAFTYGRLFISRLLGAGAPSLVARVKSARDSVMALRIHRPSSTCGEPVRCLAASTATQRRGIGFALMVNRFTAAIVGIGNAAFGVMPLDVLIPAARTPLDRLSTAALTKRGRARILSFHRSYSCFIANPIIPLEYIDGAT